MGADSAPALAAPRAVPATARAVAASCALPGLGETILGYAVRGTIRNALAFVWLGATVLLLGTFLHAAKAGDGFHLARLFALLLLLLGAHVVLVLWSVRFCAAAPPRTDSADGCAILLSLVAALLLALLALTPLLAVG